MPKFRVVRANGEHRDVIIGIDDAVIDSVNTGATDVVVMYDGRSVARHDTPRSLGAVSGRRLYYIDVL